MVATQSPRSRRKGHAQPLELSHNAKVVLERRYLAKDEQGNVIETYEDLFRRVANNLAQAERNYGADDRRVQAIAEQFYRLITRLDFLPNSPTLSGAGRPLQQLSACFVLPVEDSLESIFETVKHAALVHQGGGGCIAGDARVWTTFCGIEPIEVLFNRATLDGRPGMPHGSGVAYDVRDLGIQTVAMDPESGAAGLKPVTHVWRFDVAADDQLTVKLRDGAEVQTSAWHPFMALRGTELVEVRADGLVPGDVVLGPERPDGYWPWTEPRTVGRLTIDEQLGWLIGFTLGDGSFGYVPALRQYRVRWFSGTEDVLERVQTVLADHGIRVSIQRDRRGLLSVATLNQRFVHDLLESCGLETIGAKDSRIRVPEVIAKSPLSVVRAFVAGLLDSDGYVDTRGHVSYSTVSGEMADDLAALLGLLGYHPSVTSKAPHGKGKQVTYTVRVCSTAQVTVFTAEIVPFMANARRNGLLRAADQGQGALCLPFQPWRDRFAALGLAGRRGPGVASPFAVHLSRWSCNERGRVSRAGLETIADGVAAHDSTLAALLRRVALGGLEVEQVTRAAVAKPYYDLTVEDWNTYAAGRGGMAMVHNTGFAFSRLRPAGSIVRSTSGVASGPVSFMKVFDGATEAIKQGGTRRGANMGILNVHHPDIDQFVAMKADMTTLQNFNISVAVTEQFMRALAAGTDYDLIDPRTNAVVGTKNARALWDVLLANAWKNGDPGLIFIDIINAGKANPVPTLGPIESTNPCGEQPLYPYDSCNLGSINLARFVTTAGEAVEIDWERLGEVVALCVRFLDNVIDMNRYPLPQIQEVSNRIRRIGLGVMGWADLLYRMEIPYDSDEALALAERVMAFIQERADAASAALAEERGPFPAWPESIYGPEAGTPWANTKLRNATRTTIAPTGTLSIIADCSGGIEPVFSLAFMRQHYLDPKHPTRPTQLTEVNQYFEAVARREGFYSEELMAYLAEGGHLADRPEVPQWAKRVFVTAHDIAPVWHVRMQAAFQKSVDNAVSKCIAAGTLLPTSRGLIRIEDFAATEQEDSFTRLDYDIEVDGYKVLSHYRAGVKPATTITLDNGASLTGATASHRVLTPDGWKRMSELRVGDLVVGKFVESHGPGAAALPWESTYRTNSRAVPVPSHMTPALATLLGMLVADGHTIESTGQVGLSHKSEAVEREFCALAEEVFGVRPKVIEDKRNGVRVTYITSRNLARFIERLIGKGAYNKVVPDAILQGSAEEKLAFLRGISLDGYVKERGLCVYGGMSEQCAYHVAEVCRSFGMPKVYQGKKAVPERGVYHYVVVSGELQALIRCVEDHKNIEPAHVSFKVLVGSGVAESTHVPADHAVYSAVRALRQQRRAYCFNTTAHRLGWSADTPVYRVVTIEDAGVVDMYDIEVADAHAYVVNGMVSHNTINFPNSATVADVEEAYTLAYQEGCKGITIYRDGSREYQVLSHKPSAGSEGAAAQSSAQEEREETAPLPAPVVEWQPRRERLPDERPSITHKFQVGEQEGYITVGLFEDGRPGEVFLRVSKQGSTVSGLMESLGQLTSIALQYGVPLEGIAAKLKNARFEPYGMTANREIPTATSLVDYLYRWLERRFGHDALNGRAAGSVNGYSNGNGHGQADDRGQAAVNGNGYAGLNALHVESGVGCPECGGLLHYAEGCMTCRACGYTKCG